MENESHPEVTEGEVLEKSNKHPKYLPQHLGPRGAWKPIKIGNLGAAFRAGKGCKAGKSDFQLKPLENDSDNTVETNAEPKTSD